MSIPMQSTDWIYPEYFQTVRDYILNLQNLSIILISAASFLYYHFHTLKIRNLLFVIFTAIFGVGSLIAGLFAFSQILSLILNFTASPNNTNITTVGSYIRWQFWLDVCSLICVAIFMLFIRKDGKCEKSK